VSEEFGSGNSKLVRAPDHVFGVGRFPHVMRVTGQTTVGFLYSGRG